MKTLPEILRTLEVGGLYGDRGDSHTRALSEAQEAIAKELMGCLPKKRTIDNDHDYVDNHINKGHNQALDEVRARLTAFIGKEK